MNAFRLMAKFQFENLWQIMENYDFNKDNIIERDFLCVLCNKILINAHISSCDCRFCFDCISNYLKNGGNLCPGNSDKCKIESIVLNENIAVDNAMNNKISKLCVKCPKTNCTFTDELKNIGNHIRICNSQSSRCPYLNIGCKLYDRNDEKLIDHLQLEIENHSELLVNYIYNLSNKIVTLKIIVDKLVDENETLKSEINEIKLNGVKQMNIDREIDLLNRDIVGLRNVDSYMKDNIDEIKKNKEKSISELEKKFEQINNECKQIENEFSNSENKKKDLMINIDEMKNEQIELKAMSNIIDKTMETIENKLLELKINQNKLNYGEFIWKIDNINEKIKDAKNGINTTIYSDSFYTYKHGHKMCLSIDPNGDGDRRGTHLSVYFHLMKGEFDDILEWPFKHCVTLSLIDQQTRLDHTCETSEYYNFPNDKDWNKPNDELNDGFGSSDFISLDELETNPNLSRNNQIFIKCSMII